MKMYPLGKGKPGRQTRQSVQAGLLPRSQIDSLPQDHIIPSHVRINARICPVGSVEFKIPRKTWGSVLGSRFGIDSPLVLIRLQRVREQSRTLNTDGSKQVREESREVLGVD